MFETLNDIDYDLLWRSVIVFQPSPIESVMAEIYAAQHASRRKEPLEAWLLSLDVNSPECTEITVRVPKIGGMGLRARNLWELFRVQTGSHMSERIFGEDMTRHIACNAKDSPLQQGIKGDTGKVYPIKRAN